jgi:ribosomal protein L44E
MSSPGSEVRYRCNACGNLTRFDVVRRARTREFWHFSLGGEATVEETETLEQDIERIECRWCGNTDQIEEIARVNAEEQA